MLFSLPLIAAAFAPLAMPQEVELKPGMTIDRSVTISRRVYDIPSPSDDLDPKGIILIQGDNITIDFNGAELRGTPLETLPNERRGTAIEVRGKNVTIRNAKVRGYKNGLIAWNSPGIKILDSDFSYNWKQHLKSTIEKEDLSDWMSYHHNDNDQWIKKEKPTDRERYGAAIYLTGCDEFEVKNVKVHGGQNGLMISRSNRGLIWNNDFSFLSSLGLGMYRSSDNRIMHNKIDWAVRGYSHGRWNRGQDSAGILIYEQSHRNVFAYNSVTHGGDGFFLWAGQETMDTGKGGCNDNLLYGNDFSHAPTNGIEATFSRNNFINNLLLECWHGIWGGYSYESKVIGNVFGLNAQGIAWEHGQDNVIANNNFHRDNEAIHLWAKATEDPNWGYPKFRDTSSRDWKIENNLFTDIHTNVLRLQRTKNLTASGNILNGVGQALLDQGDNQAIAFRGNTIRMAEEPSLPGEANKFEQRPFTSVQVMQPSGNVIVQPELTPEQYMARFDVLWFPFPGGRGGTGRYDDVRSLREGNLSAGMPYAPKPLEGGNDPFIPRGELRGRRYILVDEWGPYDFKSPLLWPRGEIKQSVEQAGRIPAEARGPVHRFEILGPKGQWKVVAREGIEWVSAETGQVPGHVDVRFAASGGVGKVNLQLEYVGAETTDFRGIVTPAGQTVRFGYEQFHLPIAWNVQWWAWDPAKVADPKQNMPPLAEVVSGPALKTEQTTRLDYAWGGSPGAPVPADYFATLAEGEFEIAPGEYTLSVTTDDGIRVWVDGKLVIDRWHYQGPTNYTADLKLGGSHKIRVEHFEINGYAALKVDLAPKR
jgi:nitrous oxidase accessory protein NosD